MAPTSLTRPTCCRRGGRGGDALTTSRASGMPQHLWRCTQPIPRSGGAAPASVITASL
jgi:hypothetical protein